MIYSNQVDKKIAAFKSEYEKLLREGIDPIQAKAKIKQNIINYQEELRKEMGQKTEGSGCKRVS